MHYKFKAMQKMLSAVGTSNDFSQRPVFQKIKQVTYVPEPSSEEVAMIHNEMKNIETILVITEKEEQHGSVSSKKLKDIMSPVNRKIIEAMNIYMSAWQMVAELHNIKPKLQQSSEEQSGFGEKSENPSEENSEEQSVPCDKSETPSEEKVEIQIKSLEEIQSDRDEMSEKIIALAEKAEQMLCEIEKNITEVLDDNPIEG
ncbi:MAG: hypothetical protein ABRQ37_17675 [Candidatus Eremiobacterota bacterium]